jgi:thiol:disulfide interchange protein DsbD
MLAVLFSMLLTQAWAGGPEGIVPLRLTLEAPLIECEAGGTATLRVQLDLTAGWHTFPPQPQRNSEGAGPAPIQLELKSGRCIRLEALAKAWPVQRRWDEGFLMEVGQIKDRAILEVPVRVTPGLKPGRYEDVLRVSYQACTEQSCRPLATLELPFALQVSALAPSAASLGKANLNQDGATEAGAPITTTDREIHRRRHDGFWAFLGFAMFAGAMALLTPCVFPMVPITVSFFTARAQGMGGKALRDALLYGVGIVGTFTALGLLVALVFGAAGIQNFAASPLVNLAIAAVFLVFALNLFGALEIRPPAFILTRLGSRSGGSVAGVVLMGLTFTVTSFTCTVPFVGSALVSAARGEWFYPIVGMLGFSTVFALPFVLLALFPTAMLRLPRAGAWMNRMKVVMAFLEVAAAIKFLSNADLALGTGLLPRELFLAIWAACALLILLYLLGSFRLLQDEPTDRIGAFRALAAVGFATALFYLITGLQGRALGELEAFLPPRETEPQPQAQAAPEEGWHTDYAKALEVSRRTGRPLFIDFTGYTCTNCRWMEQNMFTRPAVAQGLANCVRVRLHTDRKVEPDLSNKQLQQRRFESIELPLYAILAPDSTVLGTCSFTRSEPDFLAFLQLAAR